MSDTLFQVAKGAVDGHEYINVVGGLANYRGGKTVVQPYEGLPPTPDDPVVIAVVSDSEEDDAVEIVVEFLDNDWKKQYCLVTTDGTTPALVPTWYLDGDPSNMSYPLVRRVNKAWVGGGVAPKGNVYVYVYSAGLNSGGIPDPEDCFACIELDINESQMALWTVPDNHMLIITYGYVSMVADPLYDDDPSAPDPSAAQVLSQESVLFAFEYRLHGGVWRRGINGGLNSIGTSFFDMKKESSPGILPPRTELRMVALDSVFKGPAVLAAGFDGIAIDLSKTSYREQLDVLDPSADPARIAAFMDGSEPAMPPGDPFYANLKIAGF